MSPDRATCVAQTGVISTMSWQVEIRTASPFSDPLAQRIQHDLTWLGLDAAAPVSVRRLYLLGGPDLTREAATRLVETLLVDPVVHESSLEPTRGPAAGGAGWVTICRRAGVTDPSEESVRRGAAALGITLDTVRCGTAFVFEGSATPGELRRIGEKLLANPVVDEILVGVRGLPTPAAPAPMLPRRVEVPLPPDDEGLARLSSDLGLALDVAEMRAIAAHFAEMDRSPTDVELETLAQTWSEHCKHKTFGARIRYDGRVIDDLLKSTVFRATLELDRDFCVSVFVDYAGIVRFDDE